MNATSAGDAQHPATSRIPGRKRPGSRMKRMHATRTTKALRQEDNPHSTTEPTEDPTTLKAKRVRPTGDNHMDEDDSDNASIASFLFTGPKIPGSNSIQRLGELRKLLKEALAVASALANAPNSPVNWDQTTIWLLECLFQTVNADFHGTQQARHNVAKLTADVEALENINRSPKQVASNPIRVGLEESTHNPNKPSTYARAAAKTSKQEQEAKASHPSSSHSKTEYRSTIDETQYLSLTT